MGAMAGAGVSQAHPSGEFTYEALNATCAYLDAHPTIDALHELSYAMTRANFGRGTMGRLVSEAVVDHCPGAALLQAWRAS